MFMRAFAPSPRKEKTSNMSNEIPQGYKKNAKGNLVPLENVSAMDQLRDEVVLQIMADVEAHSIRTSDLKRSIFNRFDTFLELAQQDHNVTLGGDKGNVTIHSFDGSYRVVRAVDDRVVFNEGITIGREKVLECIKKWSEGSNQSLVAIANNAFEVDKNGHLSASKIFSLLSYQIDDPDWQQAMDAIRSSIQVVDTKTYIRFYKRDALGKYQQIPLNGGN